LQHGVGLRAEVLSAEDAREMEPELTDEVQAGIFRPDEACLDARVFTEAVIEAARRKGAQVFAGNGAKALRMSGGLCHGLRLEEGQVEAKWTIIAAGCYSAQIEGAEVYAPVFPAKGQMIGLHSEWAKIKRILWLEHKYLVPRSDGKMIAGSTIEWTGFDRDVTVGGVKAILDAVLSMVPRLETARIDQVWAGLRPDSPDHLPIIGPTDVDGLLIATGHFRSGVLLAPVTARMIREWVTTQKVSVDWERVSPMRFLEAKGRTVVGAQC